MLGSLLVVVALLASLSRLSFLLVLKQAPPRFKIPDAVVKCMEAICPEHFEKQCCKATALVVNDAVICRRLENIHSYMDAVKQVNTNNHDIALKMHVSDECIHL